jgi:hypothetical protein
VPGAKRGVHQQLRFGLLKIFFPSKHQNTVTSQASLASVWSRQLCHSAVMPLGSYATRQLCHSAVMPLGSYATRSAKSGHLDVTLGRKQASVLTVLRDPKFSVLWITNIIVLEPYKTFQCLSLRLLCVRKRNLISFKQ